MLSQDLHPKFVYSSIILEFLSEQTAACQEWEEDTESQN